MENIARLSERLTTVRIKSKTTHAHLRRKLNLLTNFEITIRDIKVPLITGHVRLRYIALRADVLGVHLRRYVSTYSKPGFFRRFSVLPRCYTAESVRRAINLWPVRSSSIRFDMISVGVAVL